MARNPCPASVKNAGAQLVKLRRMGEALTAQAIVAMDAVRATQADMMPLGAKRMEYGQGFALLAEAMKAEGLIGQAHNSFRQALVRLDVAEPTDADIVSALGGTVSTQGGGGGNR